MSKFILPLLCILSVWAAFDIYAAVSSGDHVKILINSVCLVGYLVIIAFQLFLIRRGKLTK
jgi:hypothetical protein